MQGQVSSEFWKWKHPSTGNFTSSYLAKSVEIYLQVGSLITGICKASSVEEIEIKVSRLGLDSQIHVN